MLKSNFSIIILLFVILSFYKTKACSSKASSSEAFYPGESFPSQKSCGLSSLNFTNLERIINGQETSSKKFPWIVSIAYYTLGVYLPFCGGSVISSEHIITTGHCVRNYDPKEIFIIGGSSSGLPKIFGISSIFVHPLYPSNLFYDLALIKINGSFDQTDSLKICLPISNKVSVVYTKTLVVAGW